MKSTTQLRRTTLLAGAVLLSTSAVAAPLSDAIVTRTETIKFSPGEAVTAEGAAVLYQKLQSAAERVCQDSGDTMSLQVSYTYAACVSDALGQAVNEIGIPRVSLLHVQETPAARMVSLARR
ncbi:MAG: UrcA family protein [Steroidobacteraceae bacterium]